MHINRNAWLNKFSWVVPPYQLLKQSGTHFAHSHLRKSLIKFQPARKTAASILPKDWLSIANFTGNWKMFSFSSSSLQFILSVPTTPKQLDYWCFQILYQYRQRSVEYYGVATITFWSQHSLIVTVTVASKGGKSFPVKLWFWFTITQKKGWKKPD